MASPAGGAPAGMSVDAFLGVGTALVVVTAVFVAMRLIANIQTKRLLIDDAVPVVATLLLAGTYALAYISMKALFDPTSSLKYMAELATAIDFISGFAIWSSKAPILLLYIRLFGVKNWLKVSSYITLAVTFIIFFVGMVYTGVACSPGNKVLDIPFILNCTTTSTKIGVTLGTTSVVADLIILVLPIPVILKLQMAGPKKIGLFIVFLTGVFAIVASAVSLYYKWGSFKGTSNDLTSAMVCTVIEASIAIIVGCIPSTYSFWSQSIVKLTIYSRIKTAFSSMSGSRSRTTKSTKRSTFASNPAGGSGDHINDSSSSQYVVLGDANSMKSGMKSASTEVPLEEIKSYRN
ncbi:hypothetical protein GLAREA_06801 [Glarea lozoyensis ATCC 20868]|uniref:Rhodopsin domain-containing protein n=1 Tax=Glarea lozoyensis (strain ATCC 20868 / MF5171) TaxID=1116229 RepID=S3E617_GLAL2|nr:uncharacterized protein GLAREA_06801 [Glarea lozoyensis ATCC 20868]EPE33788.1 hypothetical protein GLAREA_06801 [Glarea lozoyensis ATCC 20868]